MCVRNQEVGLQSYIRPVVQAGGPAEQRAALMRELVHCLRTGRALRVPRGKAQAKAKAWAPVSVDVMISSRPAEAPRAGRLWGCHHGQCAQKDRNDPTGPSEAIVDLGPRQGAIRPCPIHD